MLWSEWWVWAAFAFALVILEVLAPSYIFLGFGIGAGMMAGLFALGGPLGEFFAGSWAWTLAGFAVTSLVAWIALRAVLGVRRNQVKTFSEDINDP